MRGKDDIAELDNFSMEFNIILAKNFLTILEIREHPIRC